MTILDYVNVISKVYAAGGTTEHTFRRHLENLTEGLISSIKVINEPKRIECGSPDLVISKKKIPVGYIEAKDIGKNLDEIEKSEQLKRYREGLPNLILTDYLEFRFFRDGEKVNKIQIACLENGKIKPVSENFKLFENSFANFCSYKGQPIKSPEKLAKMMALKAKIMNDSIFKRISQEDEENTLRDQLFAFREILIHDLDEITFADIYAQTISYGLFAARLHDTTIEDFTRQEARTLIPKSNPFLRSLFDYVLGPDLDDGVVWIVDDLAEIFRATDIEKIIEGFGKSTGQSDPFIHFYETFLGEYNPKLRKSRGVYYTPEPVVNFIVRAVDDVLKDEFGLAKGLADTSKTKVKYEILKRSKRSKGFKKEMREEQVHKVQILDPATGTGTFLAEIIKQIYHKFEGQKGLWSKYVEEHLIPRINGFEILMAPYTMCHLKIEMLLKDTGYVPKEKTHSKRIKVFLTNSLEEPPPESGTLFASWLSKEANAASHIKENTPVMVVIGNPPYSGESGNKGPWIMELMEDYKKEPGGKEKLKERTVKWINDDYMKFIRYGQYFIEKNGQGVLAFINPHGFLDNPTFRGVRWNLLKTYDKIYTIDLHGNSKKKEVCPDGSPDDNVFDIQQGVSINLFIKTGQKKDDELGTVYHYDLYGKRDEKYSFLRSKSIKSVNYKALPNKPPMYYMVQKDFELEEEYIEGFSLNEIFPINGVGLTTAHDSFVIKENRSDLLKLYQVFQNSERDADYLHNKFNVKKKKGWDILQGYDNIKNEKDLSKYIEHITYRPFDNRYVFYEDKLVWRTVRKVMQHFLKGKNVGLNWIRPMSSKYKFSIFISKNMTDQCSAGNKSAGAGISYIAPLYLYSNSSNRKPNLNTECVNNISGSVGLTFTVEKEVRKNTFAPIDILEYIYAILHSPSYREKYKELLKIDFPRVPYPDDAKTFWKLVKLGGELRQIHLLESPEVEKYITAYPIDGSDMVEKPKYEEGKVWINDTQYFDKVPEIAWNFYIGGYQPAQKWLKDRKGRELSYEDTLHYQKIIVALTETDRIMKKIDKVIKF